MRPKAKPDQDDAQKNVTKINFFSALSRARQSTRKLPRWQRLLLYVICIVLVFLVSSWLIDKLWQPIKAPDYGVSFSIKTAKDYGNDWRANYLALLSDLKFKHLRLMSYWDLIEPTQDHYDFADLDWQFAQAAKYGARVSLSIGLRQPRWPECHEPVWAHNLPNESNAWKDQLYAFMDTVVNHYKDNPVLESYQLENEAQNGGFGVCRSKRAPNDRLQQEFDLVKKLDPNHPVLMSLSGEYGYPIRGVVPDGYGLSVYRTIYGTGTPIHMYYTYPVSDWYHRLRIFLINNLKHRPTFIHELQLEPWGPKSTNQLSLAEQDRSMSQDKMRQAIYFGRKVGQKDIYMWGAEWWYWRKTHFNDSGPWNVIKAEVARAQSASK